MAQLSVGIVGSGLAGLTFANALRVAGIHFTIYERTPNFFDVGSGITLGESAQRILHKIDPELYSKISRRGLPLVFNQYDCTGRLLMKMDASMANTAERKLRMEKYGPALFQGYLRFELFKEFIAPLKPDHFKTGVALEDYTQNDKGVTVQLSDGTTNTHDLLVGSDGIHSKIRQLLHIKHRGALGPEPELKYSGCTLFGGSINKTPEGRDNEFGWWLGTHANNCAGQGWLALPGIAFHGDSLNLPENERVPFDPSQQQRRYDFACVQNTFKTAQEAEETIGDDPKTIEKYLTKHVAKFPKVLRETVDLYLQTPEAERTTSLKWHTHYINRDKHHKRWGHGRVTLLGDSAHAMVPWIGHGGGCGMEDAYDLTYHLIKARAGGNLSHAHLCDVIANYEKRRVPRGNKVAKRALDQGNMLFPANKFLETLRYGVGKVLNAFPSAMWMAVDEIQGFDYPAEPLQSLLRRK